jgi:hypothetical protein
LLFKLEKDCRRKTAGEGPPVMNRRWLKPPAFNMKPAERVVWQSFRISSGGMCELLRSTFIINETQSMPASMKID